MSESVAVIEIVHQLCKKWLIVCDAISFNYSLQPSWLSFPMIRTQTCTFHFLGENLADCWLNAYM